VAVLIRCCSSGNGVIFWKPRFVALMFVASSR